MSEKTPAEKLAALVKSGEKLERLVNGSRDTKLGYPRGCHPTTEQILAPMDDPANDGLLLSEKVAKCLEVSGGGEPLSEELETALKRTLLEMSWAEHGKHAMTREQILRAFAREIQQAEHDSRDFSKQNGLEVDLRASQERCKQLAEALDWYGRGIVSLQSEEHVHGMHGLGKVRDPECPMCDDGRKARETVAVYRSSEAGKP